MAKKYQIIGDFPSGDNTGGIAFTTDDTLELDEDNVLKVNVTDEVSIDNPLPITSAGVYSHLNNVVEF